MWRYLVLLLPLVSAGGFAVALSAIVPNGVGGPKTSDAPEPKLRGVTRKQKPRHTAPYARASVPSQVGGGWAGKGERVRALGHRRPNPLAKGRPYLAAPAKFLVTRCVRLPASAAHVVLEAGRSAVVPEHWVRGDPVVAVRGLGFRGAEGAAHQPSLPRSQKRRHLLARESAAAQGQGSIGPLQPPLVFDCG